MVEDEAALAAMFGVDAVGSFAETFADQFTDGGVERSDNSFRMVPLLFRKPVHHGPRLPRS